VPDRLPALLRDIEVDKDQPKNANLAPLGDIEPHAALLKRPPDDQLLYKVMAAEHLVKSITESYLHFNRVDSYKDFQGADIHDGEQLPSELGDNQNLKFARSPNFSAADYYNCCRSRTYACCFSLENSEYIWHNYGSGGRNGKICLVFKFGKFRSMLNVTLEPGKSGFLYNGIRCRQIFSVNYGLVQYLEWEKYKRTVKLAANPIEYVYMKDKARFGKEKEFRVSLSAIGVGHFPLDDGRLMDFPPKLRVKFDFVTAKANGTIHQVLCSPECDLDFLGTELKRLGIDIRTE